MSYESLHIFKLIKIQISYNFLTLWNFFLQFSTFFKIKQYQLFPMISMHVDKQCSSPLRRHFIQKKILKRVQMIKQAMIYNESLYQSKLFVSSEFIL